MAKDGGPVTSQEAKAVVEPSRIWPTESILTLEAASSMASGIPSSLAHSSATAGAFSRVRAKSGVTVPGPLDEEPDRLAPE